MYRMALCFALLGAAAVHAEDREKEKGRPDDQIDRLARRLERDARGLHEEMLTHFRKSGAFKDLDRHAKEVERLAGRIHKLADEKARPRQLRETLEKIDEEVRDIERHVRDMARDRGLDRRVYNHLRDDLTEIERTLYRIRKELP